MRTIDFVHKSASAHQTPRRLWPRAMLRARPVRRETLAARCYTQSRFPTSQQSVLRSFVGYKCVALLQGDLGVYLGHDMVPPWHTHAAHAHPQPPMSAGGHNERLSLPHHLAKRAPPADEIANRCEQPHQSRRPQRSHRSSSWTADVSASGAIRRIDLCVAFCELCFSALAGCRHRL